MHSELSIGGSQNGYCVYRVTFIGTCSSSHFAMPFAFTSCDQRLGRSERRLLEEAHGVRLALLVGHRRAHHDAFEDVAAPRVIRTCAVRSTVNRWFASAIWSE